MKKGPALSMVVLLAASFACAESLRELVKNSTPAELQAALDAGAEVDERDGEGNTPLFYAAVSNPDPEIVSLLVGAGAAPGARNKDGSTPLMFAAGNNLNPAVITRLVACGAEVDERDDGHNTALIYAAARHFNTAIISALLEAGSDTTVRNKNGLTPLMIAGQYNQNPEIVAALVKAGAPVGDRGPGGQTALTFAAANNPNPAVISALAKAGADLDEPDPRGRTALMAAARYTKNPDVIAALLREGADSKRKDFQGRSAFDYAKENKSLEGTKAFWDLDYTHVLSKGLLIVQVSFEDIYPVFYGRYDTQRVGRVVIINALDKPATDVRMSFFVKEFMNAPRDCPVPATLRPNEPAAADLFAVFQPGILMVTENMKVQAEVALEWTEQGQPRKKVIPHTFTVLKRNAVSWDDTRKAAAFVSPSDPAVLRFAKNVASMISGSVNQALDPNLTLAMAIHEALTLYGLAYSRDPIPVFTANKNVADFIQFPRQTLDNRAGKCSDLSALYASLLEAVGVETAFITIPGHIYIAAALEMSPEQARAYFGHPDELIFQAGKAWLPVEVSQREGGFVSAWLLGSREWRENMERGQAALHPMHESWKSFEPVALPGADSGLSLPDAEEIAGRLRKESAGFVEREISERAAELQAQIAQAGRAPKPVNRLGVLYAKFGLYGPARERFEQAAAMQDYLPAVLNLGKLAYAQGDIARAVAQFEKASRLNPADPAALAGLARAYDAGGDRVSAGKAYSRLKTADPALARSLAYLDGKNEAATRAAEAGRIKEIGWELE